MKNSPLRSKSYQFALDKIYLARILIAEYREYVLSKQLLKSGTSIGALVREAEFAQSRGDFISKMQIALKEANENAYWLDLLRDARIISKEQNRRLKPAGRELISMLVSTVKTAK
jgi:four helix bundle protein